jgi:thiol-disulfide isomerase/thioredoxin
MRALSFLLLFTGCATLGAGGASYTLPGEDRLMSDVVLQPVQGRELRMSSFKGKVVLLDLWASWCTPCREELPLLDDLAQRLRGEGVEIVAVSVDVERSAADELMRSRPRWHLTLGHDPALAERLSPPTMPSSYVIDAHGRLKQINCGYEPGDIHKVEAQLRALMSARPASRPVATGR